MLDIVFGFLPFSSVSFIVLYFVLICCEPIRRHYPTNLLVLGLFTCALSYMVGVISCTYKTQSVLLAFGNY